jgi:hypothetical protein
MGFAIFQSLVIWKANRMITVTELNKKNFPQIYFSYNFIINLISLLLFSPLILKFKKKYSNALLHAAILLLFCFLSYLMDTDYLY